MRELRGGFGIRSARDLLGVKLQLHKQESEHTMVVWWWGGVGGGGGGGDGGVVGGALHFGAGNL